MWTLPLAYDEGWGVPERRSRDPMDLQVRPQLPKMPIQEPPREVLQTLPGLGAEGTGDLHPAGAPSTFAPTTGGSCSGGSPDLRSCSRPSRG